MNVSPLLILVMGMTVVVTLILFLRLNAFFPLITAALLVSLLAPGEWSERVSRVAASFGSTAASVGIVIALAAVTGLALLESGAADRIARGFLALLGQPRAPAALVVSGFVLAIPVFFDTVFYLLVPLARSLSRRTGGHYLKYLMAIASGSLVTHSLVPPTPGPLANAGNLGVDPGTMVLVGLIVAIPAAAAGVVAAGWVDRRLMIPPERAGQEIRGTPDSAQLPPLGVALVPIVLPVILISANTIVQAIRPASAAADWTAVPGNPNVAMLFAATASLALLVWYRRFGRDELADVVERALMSGGVIILITAAGGAFGAMLGVAEVGNAVASLFGQGARSSGLVMLLLGFLVASLLKFAQGSSTVAMITGSAMMAAMVSPESLGFHPVYMATAVGSGAMVGVWMNDSGFWIISKMGILTEIETLRSWSLVSAVLGITALVTTLLLAMAVPLV